MASLSVPLRYVYLTRADGDDLWRRYECKRENDGSVAARRSDGVLLRSWSSEAARLAVVESARDPHWRLVLEFDVEAAALEVVR